MHDELFRITFTHRTSPPHHLVAFGFARLAGLSVWPPRKIVTNLSDTPLEPLETQLEDELCRSHHLPKNDIQNHLSDLRQRMGQSVHDILMQLDADLPPWSVSVAFYHDSGVALQEDLDDQKRSVITDLLHKCQVGRTTFQHYYTTDKPEDDIGHWCEAVKRQVWRVIRQQGTGSLLERLQEATAQKKRAAAPRAHAKQPESKQPPSRGAGDA